ncbi:MAG: matrixin family metalloprotease [Pseudomonadota bacterium]|nr:matrixin family metalloprotease [Pseudomonadota bacterium]
MSRDHRPAAKSSILQRALSGLALAVIPISSAMAMSYVPMSDEALFETADVVVSGKIVEARGAAGRELDETSYRLQPDEVLKGTIPEGELDIRLPGAFDQSARGALIIPGMPRFASDEPVLLFLNRRADRSYSPSQLLLGVFRVRRDTENESVLTQDLEQAEAIEASGETRERNRHRNARRFTDWVRERALGRSGDNTYWSDSDLASGGKYQLTIPNVRWFQFQNNQSVPVYANDSGAGTFGNNDLIDAIDAWNDAPGSTVSLAYSGISSSSAGLDVADGINQVLFNDPNNELLGTFDCLLGGLGAYGKWRSLGTREFNGQTYGVITEGDIVVQDGISCLFSGRRNENAAELLAHELGHVLGLGHSCGEGLLAICTPGTAADNALMRPTLHADGRGASLASDDIAGLAKLYAPTSSNPGGGTSNPDTPTKAESSGGGAFDLRVLLLLTLMGGAAWLLRVMLARAEENAERLRGQRRSRLQPNL